VSSASSVRYRANAQRLCYNNGETRGCAVLKERRGFVRVRPSGLVPKTATVIIDAKSPTIRCTLVDISAGGACLELPHPEQLPNRFGLLFGRVRKRCLMVWRSNHRVGVRF
jgi:PilZ domain